MAYRTAAQIISAAARACGLVTADIANPFTSTNANILKMIPLLNEVGQEILADYDWSQLTKSVTLNTVAGTQTYALPVDFHRMLAQSAWNRSTTFPVGGPLSGQAWQFLNAQSSSLSVTVFFRKQLELLYVYPTPASVQTLAYDYLSRYWVQPDNTNAPGATGPTTDLAQYASDALWFDPLLLIHGLKAKFLASSGFDSSAAARDFQIRLEQAKAQDPAPVIRLDGSRTTRFMDSRNIPDTGWGQ